MRAISKFSVLVISMLAISGCKSAPPTPKAPIFVSFGAEQRSRIEPSADSFGKITDKLASIPQEAYSGTDVTLNDTVVNQGAPSTGIKVMLKGPAFTDSLLGEPTSVSAIPLDAAGAATGSKVDIPMTSDGTDGYIGTVTDLPYTKQINITVVTPAKKGGSGEAQMFVFPLDKAGSSSAGFSHLLTVHSDGDGSEPAEATE